MTVCAETYKIYVTSLKKGQVKINEKEKEKKVY